ncbi:MAG: glutamine-hydrolyzing carbamoyl-phosphate synthase small subunit [Bacteroidales bacterium]|nr:glutamine-hydrolyzing carbamoyl-phosphate synthase small subunit [Bacteroidales bacterium]
MNYSNFKKCRLELENGMVFPGYAFGALASSRGETVFSTAMVGYPETLTDPSFEGQLLCVTYPLIGNYGVPAREVDGDGLHSTFESERIHVRALIISDLSFDYSHWSAEMSLDEWLWEQGIPGIWGVDTRRLTQVLRENGSMLGRLVQGNGTTPDFEDPNTTNLVAAASCSRVIRYREGVGKKVVLVDCGVKHNIIRCLLKTGVEVVRVPWDYDFNSDKTMDDYDGLFISNGPGNPDLCETTVGHIREAMKRGKPIFGICMGNQLLAKAAGAKTYKLRYGHRGHNQPVRMADSDKCFITSQNHGYAVDENTLPDDWEPFFTNLNDGTNEGIRHRSKPFFSVQFHPEASSGPLDTMYLFNRFVSML